METRRDPAAFEVDGQITWARPAAFVLQVGVIVSMLVALAAMVLGIRIPGLGGSRSSMVTMFGPALSLLIGRARMRRRGRVRADAAGLGVGGRLVLRRAEIREGYIIPGEATRVRLGRRGPWGPVEVGLATEPEAEALLDALGLNPRTRAVVFRGFWNLGVVAFAMLASGMALSGFVALGAGLAFAVHHSGPELLAMATLLCLALTVTVVRATTHVRVGSDGLLLRRVGSTEFLPYAAVERVATAREGGIVIRRRGGRRTFIGVAGSWTAAPPDTSSALVARIERARALAAADDRAVAALAPHVAPAGRPASEWLRALRSLGAPHTYREAAIRPDLLWRIVEDPTADAPARAGAAAALAPSLDEPGKARLRVAALASASPKLRIALEAVARSAEEAQGAEVGIERALEPLSDGRPDRSAGHRARRAG